MSTGAGPLAVLVVCTGNICRSPQAAGLLRKHLDAAGGPHAEQVRITSAGTHALVGAPMDARAAQLAAVYGAAVGDHRGSQLTDEMVRRADLVLCMTRQHRAAAVRLVPAASRRVFLLTEFVALVEDLAGAVQSAAGATDPVTPLPVPLLAHSPEQLRRGIDAAAARRGLAPKPIGVREDIVDPYRRDPEVYRESVAQIYQAVQRLRQALGRIRQGARR